MVKIELSKRDSFWVAFVIVLVGVGFVYAYTTDGSGNPAVMGHSSDELDGMASTEYVDFKIENLQTQITSLGGSSTSDLDLVNGFHSSAQCLAIGGDVETITEGKVCMVSGSSCSTYPGSWTAYKSYSTTESKSCGIIKNPCTTGYHAFSNKASETCLYDADYCALWNENDQGPYCGYTKVETKTCTATRTQIGCY